MEELRKDRERLEKLGRWITEGGWVLPPDEDGSANWALYRQAVSDRDDPLIYEGASLSEAIDNLE